MLIEATTRIAVEVAEKAVPDQMNSGRALSEVLANEPQLLPTRKTSVWTDSFTSFWCAWQQE